MTQKKISYWLKGMTAVLGIMGLLFFGGLTWYALETRRTAPENVQWQLIFFAWYTAVLCYLVLYQFWQVCTQIGRENSFSMENVRAFRRMGLCGVAEILGLAARLIWNAIAAHFDWRWVLAVFAAKAVLCAMFILLCFALSGLVQYAYEVKQENELMI